MTTTQAPRNPTLANRELRLDPRTHGKDRVPGQRKRAFDLAGFARALEAHDVDYQLASYAPHADIRIVDPDNPSPTARTIRGSHQIRSWLDNADAVNLEVTHLVDGGDRIAFTERWEQVDGTAVEATSTAELQDELITTQHTILVWHAPLSGSGHVRYSRRFCIDRRTIVD